MDMSSVRAVPAEIVIRDALTEDAGAISEIGRQAMPAQYVGLVDAAAVEAAVEQTYAPDAVVDCIARCGGRDDAVFIVAERAGRVIGYLHYDCFGPEPELHRLYVDENERASGVGGRLMDALHERVGPETAYMLLVVEGNDRAVRFYERVGLSVTELVDGLAYYAERMGVSFPPNPKPFRLVLMRRTWPDAATPGATNYKNP